MKFDCKEISINDEELGCQVNFSENKNLGAKSENMTTEEILNSIGSYLLLQRSYPEEYFENDNYYYETHDENLCGDLEDFEIVLSRHYFELKLPIGHIEISITPTEKEFIELKKILPILTNKKGKLIIKGE